MSAVCSIDWCDRKHYAKSYCRLHWTRLSKGIDLYYPVSGTENRVNHPLYSRYKSMLKRCNSPSSSAYVHYGGRGIKVCARWLGHAGFTNFVEDVGEPPSLTYTLDRIDNDGNYEPDNCRWATRSEQQHNKRVAHNNSSGTQGVVWSKTHSLWHATIKVDSKTISLAYHKDIDSAIRARKEAEKMYWNKESTHA